MRVKICGINSADAVDAAVAAGADWIGFVFFPRSPRAVTPAQAASLSARAGQEGTPQRVGLFVDPTDADIAAVLDAVKLDALQLYADAPRAVAIRSRFGRPVWRAFGVAERADLPAELAGVDALVIEPRAASDATRPGGNAQRLDWSLLRGWSAPGRWLLAGGLSPENVAAAIVATGATAVDVSSGVERAPGSKDPALILAFIAAARGGQGPEMSPAPRPCC